MRGMTFADVEAMRPGARTAVRVCMNVRPDDRVAIIGDRVSGHIARLLQEEASNITDDVHVFMLETYGKRPLRRIPPAMETALRTLRPSVTFFVASGQEGEVPFRIALLRLLVHEIRARHAHMVGITPQIMREGMAVDYHKVARVTYAVYDRVRAAEEIRVTSPEGTDLVARFHPEWRWIPSPGIYRKPGEWGNLPDGETYTAPLSVEGTLVARVVGDYFSERYGYLQEPLVVRVHEGRLVDVQGPEPLRGEFLAYTRQAENADRVGEFAIGTNIGLKRLIGNLLQDEKFPGVHIAFGNPYPEATGADWTASVHVDLVSPHTTVAVDGEIIMREGVFDFDALQLNPEQE